MAFRKKQPPSPSPWLARVIDQENEKLQIMNEIYLFRVNT